MRLGSRHAGARSSTRRGFTLLEVTIAMTFVALLAGGIVLSISTCLNVWKRCVAAADLNQEARAIFEIITRDLRGAHLGLYRNAGLFVAHPAPQGAAPFDGVQLCTESSSVARAALLPDRMRSVPQRLRPPITDYVGVRYEYRAPPRGGPGGLYRTSWVVPGGWIGLPQGAGPGPQRSELISRNMSKLVLRYYDGRKWTADYDAQRRDYQVPAAVSIRVSLRDEQQKEHEFQTAVAIASR